MTNMKWTRRGAALLILAVAGHSDGASPSAERIAPRIEAATFHSDVLGKDKRYCVVLPEGYRESRRDWPVLFLFHGRGRHEQSLIDLDDTRATLLAAPFVTVLPDGDDGWYINSPVDEQGHYADYTEEMIRDAHQRYRLSDDPARRGLSGWSMGGYGCTRFAQQHAEQFGAVAPIIGLLDFPRAGLPEGQSYTVPVDRFGSDRDVWRRLNPITHAERLRHMKILIITADRAFDRTMNEHFHRRLTELDIDHDYRVLRGSHSLAVVRAAVPEVVAFMNSAIAGEPAALESAAP